MFYRLEIDNFYCFGDPQVIDLRVTGKVPEVPDRLVPIWPDAEERVPKVIALFGANASGKSSVLKAISFIAWFVRFSFQLLPQAGLPYFHFLDEKGRNHDTRLAVELAGPADPTRLDSSEVPLCRYRYEVVLTSPKNGPARVTRETLFYWPHGKQALLFERDAESNVKEGSTFALSHYISPLKEILRSNASVIATLAQLKHPLATYLSNVAGSVSSNIFIQKQDINESMLGGLYTAQPDLLSALNRELERIDFGIESLKIEKGQSSLSTDPQHAGANAPKFSARFEHTGLAGTVPWFLESNGTCHFVSVFPHIYEALKAGGIAIVDELDLSIHPMVLPEILRWFYDTERNPLNAQLWVTCQNPSLLSELMKEEIFFCDKNLNGRASVYRLQDIDGVRRTDNFYQKYLTGVYGAVPQIG